MSALRKLRQLKLQQESAAPEAAAAAAAESTAASIVEAEKPKAGNAFDLLNEDENEENEEEAEKKPAVAAAADPVTEAAPTEKQSEMVDEAEAEADDEPSAATANTPKPEKNKKKKEKKPAAAAGNPAGATKGKKNAAPAAATASAQELEEWELEFLPSAQKDGSNEGSASSSASAAGAAASSSSPTEVWSVLRTEQKHLDASQEIRAVFGSRMESVGSGANGGDDSNRPGAQRGGFRTGGAAAMNRRSKVAGGRSSGASKRMLIKPNPKWPRTEEKGLIKMEVVVKEQVPKAPASASSSSQKASGMHGNIHSLGSSSESKAESETSDAAEQQQYRESLQRYNIQQQLALSQGTRIYRFTHSRDFERIQQEYLSTVASNDVQMLNYFTRAHPFHPESLLTMAEIFASQSEYAVAQEYLQRCLYVHENGFAMDFANLASAGLARLESDREQNLPFFTALFRHAQTLGKKGCPRTALEACKLLLSFSPLLDPTATLLALDYYAIRAKQYQFLIDFSRSLDRAVVSAYAVGNHPWSGKKADSEKATAAPGSNIQSLNSSSSSSSSSASSTPPVPPAAPRAPCTYLPNLMYSRALAAFHLENDSSSSSSSSSSSKSKGSKSSSSTVFNGAVSPAALPSAASGHSMLDAEEEAALSSASTSDVNSSSYLIQQAMLTWPSIIKPLLEAAGAEAAVNRAPWTNILSTLNGLYSTSFLSSANAAPSSSPYLAKLELIYAERAHSLWKSDKVQAWLLANAEALLARINEKKFPAEVIAKFVEARVKYLLSLPFPQAVKMLQKSQYSDHVPHLPPELLMAQQHMQFDVEGDRARMRAAQMSEAGMRELNLQQHPVRVFLQSLLPWFAAPGGGAEQQQEAPENMQEAVERIQQLPPEQREALLRNLMAEAAQNEAEEREELEALRQAGANGEDDVAEGPVDYNDYVFSEDEDDNQN